MAPPDLAAALEEVLGRGYARIPQALPADHLQALVPDDAAFVPLVEEVGLVRQSGSYAQVPLEIAPPGVRALAEQVEAAAAAAGAGTALAGLRFNEVTYQRYAPGAGHISPHRDQSFYRLLIVVVTLAGRGGFSILRGRDIDAVDASWMTEPGDVVMMRGTGLTTPEDRCPFHAVHPPPELRLSMTLRYNSLGPGGGWGATRDRGVRYADTPGNEIPTPPRVEAP